MRWVRARFSAPPRSGADVVRAFAAFAVGSMGPQASLNVVFPLPTNGRFWRFVDIVDL